MTQVRYAKSVDPVSTDGRDIDLETAGLIGEASGQKASGSSDQHIKSMARTWGELPQPQPADPAYYDLPLLNEPVWTWMIPAYYYVGGLTGAALVLGAAAQLKRSRKLDSLVRRCYWIGALGVVVSGCLLIFDLGRPGRFFNMLRVFRPTSPMNVGAWIITGVGATAVPAALLNNQSGGLGKIGTTAGYAAGVFGMALATYTGVLVANSAVPVWQASRRILPLLFGASAISSVGSAFEMLVENEAERRITRPFGLIGQCAELTSAIIMERQASSVSRVGRPLKRGFSGFLWKTANLLTLTSAIIAISSGRSRGKRIATGMLGTVGSLLMRVAVEQAGKASARDARASFHQQRAQQF